MAKENQKVQFPHILLTGSYATTNDGTKKYTSLLTYVGDKEVRMEVEVSEGLDIYMLREAIESMINNCTE